jgi:hypothetical protein
MNHRTPLLGALDAVTAARRDCQAEFDTARAAQLTATEPSINEELPQTLGALVRQLDNAARELTDAIRTVDQRERLLAREQLPGR